MSTVNLPDFSDMFALVGTITSLMKEKLSLDAEIKNAESEITKLCMTDPKYFLDGKKPSVAYIERAYYSGFEKELLPKRLKYAELCADLEGAKLAFDIYKSILDVWRTESANSRAAVM